MRPSKRIPPLQFAQHHGIQETARTLFKNLSPSYDLVLDLATLFQDRYWKSWLIDTASLESGWRVLDLGCGTCVLEEYLPEKQCNITGLDLTEEMLRLGQAKRIRCVESLFVGDAELLPYTDSCFEAVLSCYTVKYCDQKTLVKEIIRVLKPGGRLVLYDFSSPRGLFAPFHAFYVFGMMNVMGRVVSRLNPGVAFTFANLPEIIRVRGWEEQLLQALEEAGFAGVVKRSLSGGVVTAFHATKP